VGTQKSSGLSVVYVDFEPLNGFALNLILHKFMKNCPTVFSFGGNRIKTTGVFCPVKWEDTKMDPPVLGDVSSLFNSPED
jgi:hypothetical protein